MRKTTTIALLAMLLSGIMASGAAAIGERPSASTTAPAPNTSSTLNFFASVAPTPSIDVSPSAEQNDAEAQFKTGSAAYIVKDYAKAVKWLRKAAEQNHVEAQSDLGAAYYMGFGVAQDYVEAIKWFHKAAEQGSYAPAQTMLGLCYRNGNGVPKDYVEAYKWLLLAAARGDRDSKKTISGLERMMSQEEISEGQNLARNFTPQQQQPPSVQPQEKNDCMIVAAVNLKRLQPVTKWAQMLGFRYSRNGKQVPIGHVVVVFKLSDDGQLYAIDSTGTNTLPTTSTDIDSIKTALATVESTKAQATVVITGAIFLN